MNRKGIILAGGTGSRLRPLTEILSKQLVPVYDKPMIFYPLTTLMLAGIRDIFVITTLKDAPLFQKLLGDGSRWGITLSYGIQVNPGGIAEALILAKEFLDGSPSVLILGDNIFFGNGFQKDLAHAMQNSIGASIFGYHVSDPRRYGIVEFDRDGKVLSIEEKPDNPKSNYAVTGLYFFDETASSRAIELIPSERGELEITSLLQDYLVSKQLVVNQLGRGYAWFDAGTHSSLLDCANFVHSLVMRQGMQIGSPDEVAYNQNWISPDQLNHIAEMYSGLEYGSYLKSIIKSLR